MNRISLGVFLCVGLMTSAGLYAAEIPLVEWRDLSDTDVTAQGKLGLSLGDKPWKHAETKHFVYHFLDEKEAETVYLHAEVYYGWVKDFFGVEKDSWSRKAHVFIFEEKNLWEDFKARSNAAPAAEAFTNGRELYLYRNPFWLAPKKTLAHELTHVILFRFLKGPIPLFLNEGIAEYISTRAVAAQFGGDEYNVRYLGAIPEKDFIPLDQLIALKAYPEGRLELYYKESELLIRYLIPMGGKGGFYSLMLLVSQGAPFAKAVESVYGVDLVTLNQKFKRYAVGENQLTNPL